MKKILIIIVVFLSGCNSATTNREANNKSVDTFLNTQEIDTTRKTLQELKSEKPPELNKCDSYLNLLIKRSGLTSKFYYKNKIAVDEINGDTITIKIFNENEMNSEVPIRWLELHGSKVLLDVTIDPEDPILLKCDSVVANEILICNKIR